MRTTSQTTAAGTSGSGQSGLQGVPVSPVNTPRPLWKVFLFFLAPMLLSNILQSLSGTLNNVFVGQMLGTQALAAVARACFPSCSSSSRW
jgi:Na+-driven multidrug efflux pump